MTIDGPAGVGKSTVGRRVAIRLGKPFVDTGIFYRALTVAAAARGIDIGELDRLIVLAQSFRVEVNSDPLAEPGQWQARIEDRELAEELWDPGQASLLAYIARQPPVRACLLGLQRATAAQGAVAVGRDTGSVVFPEAACKIYLDATAQVRVERRRQELVSRGLVADAELLRRDIVLRDQTDRSRADSPLIVPRGAVEIMTDSLDADQVTALVLEACRERGVPPPSDISDG